MPKTKPSAEPHPWPAAAVPAGKPVVGDHPTVSTPDARYVVVRRRLWRQSNPHLDATTRQHWVHALMDARRAVKSALALADAQQLKAARAAVQQAKEALGERGAVWWSDGAPDWNRYLVHNTPYAVWFKSWCEAGFFETPAA
jgi:hypothetical protein